MERGYGIYDDMIARYIHFSSSELHSDKVGVVIKLLGYGIWVVIHN